MTTISVQNGEHWILEKIQSLVKLETALLKKQLFNIQEKIADFEKRYGKADRESLFGRIDDMELIEWEGEVESLKRLEKKLAALEEVAFEYE